MEKKRNARVFAHGTKEDTYRVAIAGGVDLWQYICSREVFCMLSYVFTHVCLSLVCA